MTNVVFNGRGVRFVAHDSYDRIEWFIALVGRPDTDAPGLSAPIAEAVGRR